VGEQGGNGSLGDLESQAVTLLETGARRVVPAAFEAVNVLFLALVSAFFFVRDGRGVFNSFLGTTPRDLRSSIERGGVAAWETLSGYVRGISIIAFTDAVLIGFGLWVIGVPSAGTIGVLTFFAGYVPFIGAITAGAVGVLLAFASGGLTLALIALAIIVGVQQLEGNVLEPLVVGRAVDLHPLLVIVVLVTGGIVAGFVGLVLAVPLAAVIAKVLRTLREEPEAKPVSERLAGEQGAVATDLAEPTEP
jgi:putative heme transporter